MKTAVATAVLGSVAARSPTFTEYMVKYEKQYQTREEVLLRRSIFNANVAKIEKHNSEGHNFQMGVNAFADLTGEEFSSRFISGLAGTSEDRREDASLLNVKDLPATVDWTTAGAVTGVKNQGQCGSCWSFSTTGSVEGINFIKTGTLVSLSEQQLVDCSSAYGNNACNGGLMDNAFRYIIANNGLCSELAYPYVSGNTLQAGTCASANCTSAATISGYTDVPVNSSIALQTAVAQQPVSIAIEADQGSFQFYTGGVMDAPCGTALDHGVLVVGYGTDTSTGSPLDFWKVKNSWGASWGEAGYIRLGRGAQFAPSGQCGILLSASYPTKN